MKVLVTGWFSFEQMGASAGDLIARDLACQWLRRAGRAYDVATAPPFTGNVDWRAVNASDYAHVLFVCGPFGNGPPLLEFLEKFEGRLVGLNLTMLQSLEEWNPFEFLIERDSSRTANPDIVFGAPLRRPTVPVVGLVLIDEQPEYPTDVKHLANSALTRLIDSRELAVIRIDTRLDENRTGLRTPAEVEAVIARMDVILTTRLHGTVLALKNGIPAIVVDAVAGGAKVLRQAEAIGWPVVFTADAVTDQQLSIAFDYCLTSDARTKASDCRCRAAAKVAELGEDFVAWMRTAS
jgi:hypothetical protein